MLVDISPLIKHREFRLLYLGQAISFFGTVITMVAVPYQIYQLTRSTLLVGMISLCELIPLLFTALIGGAFSDRMNRRQLILVMEICLAICTGLLIGNSLLPHPQVWVIFLVGMMMSGLSGFHRPAIEGMTPLLVDKSELSSVSILQIFKFNVAMIGGPLVTGLIMAHYGLAITYSLDLISYVISIGAIYLMRPTPTPEKAADSTTFTAIKEGVRFAMSRQELFGSYAVDIIAMIFGMPNALFPAIAEQFGGAKVVGLFYSAPAIGAFIFSFLSGWTRSVKQHGKGIIFAAIAWGIAIILFGLMHNLWWALFFLGLAGAADTLSGIFRMTLWNESIPNHLRGRLAGIEMISYMSGPLLGNAEAGIVAALFGVTASVVSGGAICVAGVIICSYFLPQFWKYRSNVNLST